jgi:ribonucleoside-diphosphate reductase alpha chain
MNAFADEISHHIWESKYRYRSGAGAQERGLEDSWRRVAHALAAVEREPAVWEERFLEILRGFRFLPGGRILAGAGTPLRVTLFNCFVMGAIDDSMDGIFEALKEGALTMQQGGGVGYDFSTLRPRGTRAAGVGAIASGPVSFLRVWDSMCATVLSTGSRRGAMMATLRCDHPDIEVFIDAKGEAGALTHFNLSVQVTDDLLLAVERDEPWPLVFPSAALGSESAGETILRRWTGSARPVPCRVFRWVPARALWEKLLRASFDHAEPGVLFIDQINLWNNLWYCERLTATNPCGEIPLPPYGACDLGSLNLVRFVEKPFTPEARLDFDSLAATAATAVRLLDDVIDVSQFPLPRQETQVRSARRIGLGLTGLGDALALLGLPYDSLAARATAAAAMRTICHAAYRASTGLAREKGSFPSFDRERYMEGKFIRALPSEIQEAIAAHGIRNSHLTAIAPAGTISLLAGNISSGLEPIFDLRYHRKLFDFAANPRELELTDAAFAEWEKLHPAGAIPGRLFVTARDLPPSAHLEMQAALQPFVDNAIAKTINVPAGFSFDDFRNIYEQAWRLGLKGLTTFRPNPVTGEILSSSESPSAHCCTIEREAD